LRARLYSCVVMGSLLLGMLLLGACGGRPCWSDAKASAASCRLSSSTAMAAFFSCCHMKYGLIGGRASRESVRGSLGVSGIGVVTLVILLDLAWKCLPMHSACASGPPSIRCPSGPLRRRSSGTWCSLTSSASPPPRLPSTHLQPPALPWPCPLP